MAAETRKWYVGNLIGSEGNYTFVVPMSESEMETLSNIFKRVKCINNEDYSPCLSIYSKPYDKEDIDEWYYGEPRHLDLPYNDETNICNVGIGGEEDYSYMAEEDT